VRLRPEGSGHRCGAGLGEQHARGREPGAVLAHLGEHDRGGHLTHAWEAEEDRRVWVLGQALTDPLGDRPNLRIEQLELLDE